MAFGKIILTFLLAFSLGAYVTDCFAMAAPDEAMKCCDSMPCAPHSHDRPQHCCETMPSTHAALVQPSASGFSFSLIFIALVTLDSGARSFGSSIATFAAHCHAPPVPHNINISPLRI
jgi:hypothetical protein